MQLFGQDTHSHSHSHSPPLPFVLFFFYFAFHVTFKFNKFALGQSNWNSCCLFFKTNSVAAAFNRLALSYRLVRVAKVLKKVGRYESYAQRFIKILVAVAVILL